MWPKVVGYNVVGLLIFLAGAVVSVAMGLLTAQVPLPQGLSYLVFAACWASAP